MDDEKFLRSIDGALGNWLDRELQEPPRFGGKPGEPVPAVDPEDVKTVWQIGRDAQAHAGKNVAVGADLMKRACKPGANIEAVTYRSWLIWLTEQIAPEQLARFTRESQPDDAVFRAAGKITAKWMGVGIVHQGPPFDVNEFLRLCDEEVERV